MQKQQIKDYYKEALMQLDFVESDSMAEEALKAVLGVLTSKLSEQEAKEFTATLPEYLTYETLRGHQAKPTLAKPLDTVEILANKFDLSQDKATELMHEIISVTKAQAPGELSHMMVELPDEWQKTVDLVKRKDFKEKAEKES